MTATLNSSLLASASYDAGARTLTVVFNTGRSYTYQNVDQSVFEGLRSATSPGRFFGQQIRGAFTVAG